ncbi:heavy-metal-associated domain-containing protein [Nitrogeniibacter mangrovi]|uniref:Heavy-metal-associated domain-containing protein n=1 Tax=Nitrogeniibacter mangrovi TaxID=2016596 RepID=A0A6C1B4L2_9RHOO|nr:heavy-metal-associated domain-containing protein [Nitrogeniibacter mangrovi]QID17220.1 heavy-metal-associated domain-containing protein [Nitrogeniibacter mangrovi]
METIQFKVEGMSCQGCVKGVTAALSAIDGVAEVKVELEAAQATVQYDPATASVAQLHQAVEEAGFDVA